MSSTTNSTATEIQNNEPSNSSLPADTLFKIKSLRFVEVGSDGMLKAEGVCYTYVSRRHKYKKDVLVLTVTHKTDRTIPVETRDFNSLAALSRFANQHNRDHVSLVLEPVKTPKSKTK